MHKIYLNLLILEFLLTPELLYFSGVYLNGRGVESIANGLSSPNPSCEPISNIAVPPSITILIDK